jgi:hypothetical protein
MGFPCTVTLSPPQADEGSGFFVRLWRTQNDGVFEGGPQPDEDQC